MRLICPNCETEYEVEDSAIPADGRDVQCSNCMRAWFQMGADAPALEAANVALDADLGAPDATDYPLSEPDQDPDAPTRSDGQPADDDGSSAALAAAAAAVAGPRKLPVSSESLDILKDEVERETAARREEAESLETQTEFGLEEGTDESMALARDRMARLRAEVTGVIKASREESDDDAEPDGQLEPGVTQRESAKRQLLPDIEEINSTLASTPDPVDLSEGDNESELARRLRDRNSRGFRFGFGLMLLVASGVMMSYIYAAQLAEYFPQTKDLLISYAQGIDRFRFWLDTSAQDVVEQITDLIGQISG